MKMNNQHNSDTFNINGKLIFTETQKANLH